MEFLIRLGLAHRFSPSELRSAMEDYIRFDMWDRVEIGPNHSNREYYQMMTGRLSSAITLAVFLGNAW